ncbi:MAG: ribulose-bisphosphate carboxylase large subunit, partial [Thermoplasmata archaeon]
MYGGYTYLELDYEPDKTNDIIVLHWVSGRESIEKLAEALAAESSVGTWTELKTINTDVFENLRARVFRIDKVSENSGFVWLAYPLGHFDVKNLLQILASIRGNVYGLDELTALIFLDIYFPEKLQKQFSGPAIGLNGVRKRIGTDKDGRPHIGTIVKPKVGLAPKEWAQVAYEAYLGGIDFVKEDENLVDQPFCPWNERVDAVLEVVDKIKSETGRAVLYSPNITDRYSKMLERIDYLKEAGWDVAMLDVYMIGYGGLIEIVEHLHKNKFIIHAHRAGHTAEDRGEFGCSFSVFAKLWRLIGVDQLLTGTGIGKMEGAPAIVRRYADICREQHLEEALHLLSLEYKWDDNIKPVMPVASGGINAGLVDGLVQIFGKDIVIQAGGGIHGHPDGTVAGARSLRCAMEGVMEGISSPEKAEECPELKAALDKWGYVEPEGIRKKFDFSEENKDSLLKELFEKGYR